jgi:ABC-type molybdate transport system ATPase subunit
MADITFDLVLRYLYFQRNVLHRDISKGNIMIVDSPTIASDSKGKHKELCFIKHLQDSRSVQVLYHSQQLLIRRSAPLDVIHMRHLCCSSTSTTGNTSQKRLVKSMSGRSERSVDPLPLRLQQFAHRYCLLAGNTWLRSPRRAARRTTSTPQTALPI